MRSYIPFDKLSEAISLIGEPSGVKLQLSNLNKRVPNKFKGLIAKIINNDCFMNMSSEDIISLENLFYDDNYNRVSGKFAAPSISNVYWLFSDAVIDLSSTGLTVYQPSGAETVLDVLINKKINLSKQYFDDFYEQLCKAGFNSCSADN